MSPVTLSDFRVAGNIIETSDYKKFKWLKGNRAIRRKHVDAMVAARKAGKRIDHMTTAIEHNGNYYIVDGQHYFQSAKEVGCPFLFRVINAPISEGIEITLRMNCHQESWKSYEYRDLWIARNREPYKELKSFQEESEIDNVDLAIILLGKDQSSRSMKIFREGGYIMGDTELASKRINLLNSFSEYLNYAWTRNFVRAVCQLSTIGNYKHDHMMKRLKRVRMKKQASTELYMELIRTVYNTGSLSDHQRI